MAIGEGGDSSRASGPMTAEEQKLVELMNRNLNQTGRHTNPNGGRARRQSKEENTNSKSTERNRIY